MVLPTFDLRDRPWLPVRVGLDTRHVGLRWLLSHAHEVDDLAVAIPPAATGLWRVLYALAARITGLDDPDLSADEWTDLRLQVAERGRMDESAVDAYLDRWAERFDLFHPERPWLQDPRLSSECRKSAGVNKLVFDRPSGQNQIWFGHFVDAALAPIGPAEAAWYLVAQHFHGAGGRCSTRTVGATTESNTKVGPLRGTVAYHPIGRTVFESLLAGLPMADREPDSDEPADRCPWELDELPDPLGLPTPPTWPGGLLTGRSRHAVLLVPDHTGDHVVDVRLTWAWRQPSRPVDDPYLIRRRNKKDGTWYSQPADATRALWRDLDALLHRSGTDVQRPAVMLTCQALPFWQEIRLRAYGFDQETGQARDNQWYTAAAPPVLRCAEERDPVAVQAIADFRDAAEQLESTLRYVLRKAWQQVSHLDKGPWPRRAAAYFWPRAETAFWRMVESGQFKRDDQSLLEIAMAGIDHAVGTQDRLPRIAKAINEAKRRLAAAGRRREIA